jgi:type I pantothenate kinase
VNLTFDLAVEGIVERLPMPQPGGVVCIGVAGPVAAGKSAMARALATALPEGLRVDVLSTDGFLFPNAELAHRGLLGHKGYPDTYDADALRRVVGDLRRGRSLLVPEYSHETYDVVPDARVAGPCDVLVVEGLHALTHLRDLLDVSVFVDADVGLLEQWYVERFQMLRAEARDDPSSFYASMAAMSEDDADVLARQVWREVNLPNSVQHVAIERTFANIVVVKGPEHCVLGVEIRSGPSGGHA